MTHYFFISGSFNPLSSGTSMFCVIPSSIQCVTLVTIILVTGPGLLVTCDTCITLSPPHSCLCSSFSKIMITVTCCVFVSLFVVFQCLSYHIFSLSKNLSNQYSSLIWVDDGLDGLLVSWAHMNISLFKQINVMDRVPRVNLAEGFDFSFALFKWKYAPQILPPTNLNRTGLELLQNVQGCTV